MRVTWLDAAHQQFADAYVLPDLVMRAALERAYHRVNARLGEDPAGVGESRGGLHRVWFTAPLMVAYRLEPGGGVVIYRVVALKDLGDGPD